MLYDGIIQISLIRKIPWINRYIIWGWSSPIFA